MKRIVLALVAALALSLVFIQTSAADARETWVVVKDKTVCYAAVRPSLDEPFVFEPFEDPLPIGTTVAMLPQNHPWNGWVLVGINDPLPPHGSVNSCLVKPGSIAPTGGDGNIEAVSTDTYFDVTMFTLVGDETPESKGFLRDLGDLLLDVFGSIAFVAGTVILSTLSHLIWRGYQYYKADRKWERERNNNPPEPTWDYIYKRR